MPSLSAEIDNKLMDRVNGAAVEAVVRADRGGVDRATRVHALEPQARMPGVLREELVRLRGLPPDLDRQERAAVPDAPGGAGGHISRAPSTGSVPAS